MASAIAGVPASKVQDVFIWGNHANTMYPDARLGTVDGQSATELFDTDWLHGDFLETVSTRGKAIIMARGASSAASAASAAVDHMRDWWQGSNGRIVSVALPSEGWYGVPEGIVFSFPCRCENGEIIVIDNASTNNDYQILSSSILLNDPRIKLYRNNINNGFSGGNMDGYQKKIFCKS